MINNKMFLIEKDDKNDKKLFVEFLKLKKENTTLKHKIGILEDKNKILREAIAILSGESNFLREEK